MSLINPKLRKLLWDLVAIVAAVGVIYGTIQYFEHAGAWKTLVMVPLLLVLGYLAIEVIYPLWYGNE